MDNNFDKELISKYHREITVNILILIGLSGLSIIGPLVLRDAIDYNVELGFDIGLILLYATTITLLYILKFFYQRFKFWFTEKFKNDETVNLYKKIFHVKYEKINFMEPSYIVERVQSTIAIIFD